MSYPASQAHSLLQQLTERSYRAKQQFLWQGCDIATPGTFDIVYANELTTETYRKILVLANGEIHCNIDTPALLLLGTHHVQDEFITLLMLYNENTNQAENEWWRLLRQHYQLPAIYGDIVFALKGESLTWDKNKFVVRVAHALAHAK